MAQFTKDIGNIEQADDIKKVKSYLYKLNNNLEYMFYHLTPQDNYSNEAWEKYVSDGEKMVQFGLDIDGIRMTMVTKDGVVAAINLSEEGVKIKGTKISLEGTVTANNYFKINLDGSMEATNGTFSGAIRGGSIDIKRGSKIGLYCNGNTFQFGDFYVDDEYGRQILQSSDECTGMSGEPNSSGGLFLWAGYYSPTNYSFLVNSAGAYTTYGSNRYNIGEEIYKLWQRVGGGGGGGGCSSDSDGCGCDGDTWTPCGCDGDCEVIVG